MNSVRIEVDGRLAEIELEHQQEDKRRTEDAEAAASGAPRKALEALRLAAAELVQALTEPDAAGYNVGKARDAVASANARIEGGTNLARYFRDLLQASQTDDLAAARAASARIHDFSS